jgi:DNA-directed RNA polymerase sigma subunit (sigma70/sigma32)
LLPSEGRFSSAIFRAVPLIAKEPLSLDTPIGGEEQSHLSDFIEDTNAILPLDTAIQSELRETTTRVLASRYVRPLHADPTASACLLTDREGKEPRKLRGNRGSRDRAPVRSRR